MSKKSAIADHRKDILEKANQEEPTLVKRSMFIQAEVKKTKQHMNLLRNYFGKEKPAKVGEGGLDITNMKFDDTDEINVDRIKARKR